MRPSILLSLTLSAVLVNAQTRLATPTDKSNIIPERMEYNYVNWSESLGRANDLVKDAKLQNEKGHNITDRLRLYYILLTDQPEDILLPFWDGIEVNRYLTCSSYKHHLRPDKEKNNFYYKYYKREHSIMSKVCGAVQQSYNKTLQNTISTMSEDDVKYRKTSVTNIVEQEKLDLINQDKAIKIIDKYGFPNLNIIDEGLNEFMTIILRGDKKYVEHLAPLINHEIRIGRIPGFHTVRLVDRLCQLNNKPQEYGTVYIISANGERELYKHIDIEQVNLNRAKYGYDAL